MSQISHQMKSTSKLEISYLEGSFSGLNDLLVVFPFDLPRERPQLDALCDTIIKCSEFQIGKPFFSLRNCKNCQSNCWFLVLESERRIHRRAALLIFARHCKTLFGSRLVELSECKHW